MLRFRICSIIDTVRFYHTLIAPNNYLKNMFNQCRKSLANVV